MRIKVLVVALFIISNLFAQQKYQSLLWKISGNGLQKESYLYGTMHVSSKVAFRLDDVFYESLSKSDVIALESDPTTWLENSYELLNEGSRYYTMNYGYGRGGNFYTNLFKLNFPNDFSVRSAIRFDNSIINGYLYRKQMGADNFEEETYLDMFIFQAGKKNHKKVVGLEDFNESRYLTTKASYNVVKKKMDVWLRKLYKEKSSFLITEEAYRNRNLDLLDSIGEATNTPHFRKYMLFERNRNMVRVLDSLMQQNNAVFTGVGAAHLPGKNGIIELLRSKGYTVAPLTSKQTPYGKLLKNKLEATFITPKLQTYATKDHFLTIKSFEKLRELNFLNQKYYVATDMANGAYLAITRVNTFEYLNSKSKIKLKDIDNLLYEDIPGEILKKEYFEQPYEGIKILNKTKKGDYQRYAIYKTPLEIIIVKLGGKKDYVLKYGDEVFDSISFKPNNDNWVNFTPNYGKYTFSVPANYVTENYGLSGKKMVQSFDKNGFYFFEEVPLFDVNYIEEDAFEASYIHKAFLTDLKLEKDKGNFVKNDYKSYQSTTEIDSTGHKKLVLKTLVKDEIYYLMGYVGKDTIDANTYFNSFTLKDIVYDKTPTIVKDTSLYFSVKTIAKQPFPFRNFFGNQKHKKYERSIKKAQYSSKTNESISIERTKYHDFQMFKNIDSLWKSIEEPYKEDFIITHRQKTKENDIYAYTFLLRDSLSVKQIRVKNILKKGILYELKTLEDSLSNSSAFVEDFYSSFTPLDTLLGKGLFVNKVPDFLEALQKNDSVVYSAYALLTYKNEDADALIDIIKNHDFPKDQQEIKKYLISELSELESPRILPFFKELYRTSYRNPQTQVAIIKALIAKKNKESIELILELFDTDFPVGSANMANMFWLPKYKDSLKLKRKLFPKLLEFSTVPEYKRPIYGMLLQLMNHKLIKPKSYKKYKNQLINDAKLELKRSLFKEDGNRFSGGFYSGKSSILGVYTSLLFPFRDEKNVAVFLSRLLESNDVEAMSSYYVLLKKNNLAIPEKLHDILFDKIENIGVLVASLEENNMAQDVLKTEKFQQKYAQSKLFPNQNYSQSRDSIIFMQKEVLKTVSKTINIYFFKKKTKNEYANRNSLHYIAFEVKGNIFVSTPYFKSGYNGDNIDETKTEKEMIGEAIDKVRYKNRKRLAGRNYAPTIDF
ncbi:MAG TPA: TraB/GumN family protein [Flavobacteriia bacterium]|nr:TraB/GumN family protein [Flavobacteriia bacterium]